MNFYYIVYYKYWLQMVWLKIKLEYNKYIVPDV
jgi:hypothetical protein